MSRYFLPKYLTTILIALGLSITILSAQNKDVTIGAYYFDGWTGRYPYHITQSLLDSFPEREPKWGWLTSTQSIIDEQICTASEAGLSFFSFCWYYNGKNTFQKEPLNQALGFYLQSKYRTRLRYCLMVANHYGFEIGKEDWPLLITEWIKYFKGNSYLNVEGKPLIIFLGVKSMIQRFGSVENVRLAFDSLRNAAKADGLAGVTVAVCTNPLEEEIKQTINCDPDILTGYNYHTAGFVKGERLIPIDSLRTGEIRAWNKLVQLSPLKYIPVCTLNWDPRPWATRSNGYSKASYYIGYSPESVCRSTQSVLYWTKNHSKAMTKEKIVLLYAWNENGEGAYLTPSRNGTDMLQGVRKALMEIKK
ncbi:MAG TPA: glycoside hydrolase family 99-like domain-containing protein [Cytophagaceae bacterium]|jgi:hypothetical protein|nr:glycoside hydrolase family 99-like domain-containing protein [Cytophagaceae bacterium]